MKYKKQSETVKLPLKTYDTKGNLTYWENSNGDRFAVEYDGEGLNEN